MNPFLKPKAGETITIMDVTGPGVIQHIWMATETNWIGNGRACVLRFYWDDETITFGRGSAHRLLRRRA